VERRARILTLLTYYHPHWTGLTAYATNIAEGLAARGHRVSVLTSRHDDDLPLEENVNGVQVRRLPTVGRVSRAMVMPTFPTEVRRALADHDLVHVHSPMPEAALVVGLARSAGVATLITHQGDVVMPAGALNRAIQGVMDLNLASAVRRADAVVTHSADYAGKSRLLTRRGRPVEAIAPPTYIPEPRADTVARWRAELGVADRPVVGFAGRFVEEKGFDFLLEAVPIIRAAVPDVHFVFAGETGVVYERFFDRCRPMLERHQDAITSSSPRAATASQACRWRLCSVARLWSPPTSPVPARWSSARGWAGW
jgi:glycosyltransferase involved in cell wall biosynthesis